ncbi:MAG: hypothetical protein IK095_03450 [Oscillospiraceae bacterium]|nr:hypothetical protein [Oscillospiraceae bacterium]
MKMIDSGFGLEIWEEEGGSALRERKKVLEAFRKKLLSALPPKKKIEPDLHTERIFTDGDVLAIQLQTAGKRYTQNRLRAMTDEEFRSCDGKYVLIQLVCCRADWRSAIVPEVGRYWAVFRLFQGLYDSVPDDVDVSGLRSIVSNSDRDLFVCCERGPAIPAI